MSQEDQTWNSSVQIGFGDEIGQESLNEYWPSSTQSPGISPQPSPDSQLLERVSQSSDTSSSPSLQTIAKSSAAHQTSQAPSYTGSASSQPNLPQSRSHPVQYSHPQSPSNTSSQASTDSQSGLKSKNVLSSPSRNSPVQTGNRLPPPPPVPHPPSFQNVQMKNVGGKMAANQNVSQNSSSMSFPPQQHNMGPSIRPVRPASAGQQHARSQGPGNNAQEPRQSVKAPPNSAPSSQVPVASQNPSHPKGSAPSAPHNFPSGQQQLRQQQQQHFQSPASSAGRPPPSSHIPTPQPGQPRPNIHPNTTTNLNTGPRAMVPHNQPTVQPPARPQVGPGPQNPRLSPPGQLNPRMRMGGQMPMQGPRMMRPPHPTNSVGPRIDGPRFTGQNPNQVRPRHPPPSPQGVQHNTPEQDPYEDYDDEDEEDEDMFYDEDEAEDYDDAMYGDMHYGDDYESEGSNSSDEEHMMLTEYIECQDPERSAFLYDQLRARGVPAEEIAEFKENCSRRRGIQEMDYDEEMEDEDDEDDDDYPDEEMVSSSTSMPVGMQQGPRGPSYHHSQQGPGQRIIASSKEGYPQSHPSPSSSSSFHQFPQGVQSSPRPQGSSPQRLPSQRFPVSPQKRPGPPGHPSVSSPSTSQGSGHVLPQTQPQPRMPSPIKSQNSGGPSFQGNNQKQVPLPPQCSISSTEGQNQLKQSSPQQQQQMSPSGQVASSRAPAPQPSPQQPLGSSVPSSSQPQPSNASQASTAQMPPPPARPPPPPQTVPHSGSSSSGDSGNLALGQPGSLVMRPPRPRPPVPRHQQHRFPQANPQAFHGHQRMRPPGVQHSRLRATLLGGNIAHSDAERARLAVLEMQKSLDQEIRAKKGNPAAGPLHDQMSPHHQFQGVPHFQTGRPRLQNSAMAGSSSIVRHQLPPRTPFPRTHGPRTARPPIARPVCSVPPFTSHTPQQALPPNPRPPGPANVGNVPRLRGAAPTAYTPNAAQAAVASRPNPPMNPAQQQQTSTSVSAPQMGMRSPSPKTIPAAQLGPLAAQTEPPADQPRQLPSPSLGANQTTSQPAPVVPQVSQPQQPQQQLSQQASSKSESFNLCSLSEDKCIIKGTQRLVVNTVYHIKSPIDQSSKLARWNGERFEDLEPIAEKPTSAQAKVAAAQPPSQASTLTTETTLASAQGQNQPPNVRNDNKGTTDPALNQSTYVKPLTEENLEGNAKVNPADEENEDEFIFKKPLNENEEHFRVCNYCGYTSKNFKQCESCKRIFRGEVKIHIQKKKPPSGSTATSASSSSSSSSASSSSSSTTSSDTGGAKLKIVPKQGQEEKSQPDRMQEVMGAVDFYGNNNNSNSRRGRGRPMRGMAGRTRGGGMKGRGGGSKAQDDYDSSDSEDSVGKQTNDRPPDGPIKRKVGRGRARNAAPRKRSKKVDEPVTVMISSDEDEPSSTSNMSQGAGPAPSPASSAGSESPIFPGRHLAPPSTYGRFRRMLMEDEQGNSKISKKLSQQALSAMGMEEEDFDDEDDDEDGDEPPTYEIEIRSIRVGSMRTKPLAPLFLNMRGVCFRVTSERTEETFECEILSSDVEYVKYFGGQSPILFFLITQECGEKLRDIFHMEEGGDEYLDPSSTDLKQKMVVIIVESSNYLPQDMRETLSLWADINRVDDSDFIEELSEEAANDLLIQSAPAVLTADLEHDVLSFKKIYIKTEKNSLLVMPKGSGSPSRGADNEPDSTSSSPPQQTDLKQYFDGPPIRLLQYPPPPARGIAITTEDLICLHEGEFLNDVIIDFYLQYLYQEKISEELKSRTHIFSSFFYKRLTQRDRHSDKTEEDAKRSLPERRHARVKTWTKTVDLFSKDFIIVPINENSHWYLAVICFPGLATPEVVPYLPNKAHRGEADNDNSDAEGQPSEEGTSEEKAAAAPETPKPKARKTILGKCVDPKECLNSDDVKYYFGQKAPCILMFDSLAGPSRTPNVKMLREYLQCEWNAKKTEPRLISKLLKGTTPKVPQQSNFSDCGVYLLQYVESFFEDPIADFQIPMKGLQQWFSEKHIATKRMEIHELIMRLHRRYQEKRGDPKILDIRYDSGPPREDFPPPHHPPPHHPPGPHGPHPPAYQDQQQPHPHNHQHPHPHHMPPHPHHHLPHHQHHPPPHHLPHHQHQGHLPHPPPLPQGEQPWPDEDHPGYLDPSDNGMLGGQEEDEEEGGEDEEMDPGAFMDSGDSSNSGSMPDPEEQNFLYPPAGQESFGDNKNDEQHLQEQHQHQQQQASFKQGNNSRQSSLSAFPERTGSLAGGSNLDQNHQSTAGDIGNVSGGGGGAGLEDGGATVGFNQGSNKDQPQQHHPFNFLSQPHSQDDDDDDGGEAMDDAGDEQNDECGEEDGYEEGSLSAPAPIPPSGSAEGRENHDEGSTNSGSMRQEAS